MCVVYMLDRLLGDLTVQATGRTPPPKKKRPSSVFFVPFQLAVTKHPETHRGSLLSSGIVLRTGLVPGVLVVKTMGPCRSRNQSTTSQKDARVDHGTNTLPPLSRGVSMDSWLFVLPVVSRLPGPLSFSFFTSSE